VTFQEDNMTFKRTLTMVRLALATALVATAANSAAQTYPTGPIRMVVGFPPGGGVDLAARLIATGMSKVLGQTIVIENRAGAGGSIGALAVAKAQPDGYTILMGNTGSLTINPFVTPGQSVRTLNDFEPVALVSSSPLAIVAKNTLPVQNMSEFVKLAKSAPDKYTFGTGGSGSISHLAIDLLKLETGIKLLHVPYKGGSPAIQDLLANQVDIVIDGVPLAAPLVLDGRIKGLAVTSKDRSTVLPKVPTLVESGFPNIVISAWYGIVVPKGTPSHVVDALNRAVNISLKDPEMQKKFVQQGSSVAGGTPAEFGAYLQNELNRWEKAVKASGMKAQ